MPARVTEPGEERYWISPGLFRATLDLVVGRPDVRLSFDDGNSSDVESGLPALAERGLTATFFALAGRLDHRGSLAPVDLVELQSHGHTIGTHGMRHIPWRGLTAAQQHEEFVQARRVLEAVTGRPVLDAALPLGRYDRSVLGSLRAAGYRTVYSSDRLPGRDGFLRPRYSLRNDDTIANVRRILSGPPLREWVSTRTKIFIKSRRPAARVG